MKKLILFTIGVVGILQACSPEPVYRLQAEADKTQTSYYQGVEYIHLQQDSIFLTVSYYEHTSKMFALEVEVINDSDRIIRIAPDSFAYKSYRGSHPEDLEKFLAYREAKDPEQKILNLDLALSQQKANQKTDELLFYTLQGVTLADGIISDSEKEKKEARQQLTENAVNQEVDRAQYRRNRPSLRGSKKFWQTDALRVSDLWPGEKISGLVYFDMDGEAQLYHILMKIEGLKFETWFRQQKFDPGGEDDSY